MTYIILEKILLVVIGILIGQAIIRLSKWHHLRIRKQIVWNQIRKELLEAATQQLLNPDKVITFECEWDLEADVFCSTTISKR